MEQLQKQKNILQAEIEVISKRNLELKEEIQLIEEEISKKNLETQIEDISIMNLELETKKQKFLKNCLQIKGAKKYWLLGHSMQQGH